MRAFFLALGLAAGMTSIDVPQAAAQSRPAPECSDDNGVDRCSAEEHRRVLDLFGLQPVEAHIRSNHQIRRAFYVDGYGRDLVALAFVRAPGGDPTLHVYFPRKADNSRSQPLTALVPREVWDEVIDGSANFDRRFQPRPGEADNMCLHSWVYTVEANDPELLAEREAGVRRAVEDACAGGMAASYARKLSELAVRLLPPCVALGEHPRGGAGLLAECEMLGGDRIAAADAATAVAEFARGTVLQRPEARFAFTQEAVLIWPGSPPVTGLEAGERWLALTGPPPEPNADDPLALPRLPGLGSMSISLRRAVGESWARVRVEAELSGRAGTAPLTLIMERYPNGIGFQVSRAEVGTFVARREDAH